MPGVCHPQDQELPPGEGLASGSVPLTQLEIALWRRPGRYDYASLRSTNHPQERPGPKSVRPSGAGIALRRRPGRNKYLSLRSHLQEKAWPPGVCIAITLGKLSHKGIVS
jgi:hypothetical protein